MHFGGFRVQYPPGTKPTEMRPESVRVLGLLRTAVHEGGTLGERKPKREALRVALSRAITSAGATARASFTLSVLMTVRSDLLFATFGPAWYGLASAFVHWAQP